VTEVRRAVVDVGAQEQPVGQRVRFADRAITVPRTLIDQPDPELLD
jgi:hypothetical protein